MYSIQYIRSHLAEGHNSANLFTAHRSSATKPLFPSQKEISYSLFYLQRKIWSHRSLQSFQNFISLIFNPKEVYDERKKIWDNW